MPDRELLAAPISPQLESIEEYIENRDDKREIVDQLTASVVAQEITRMVVTENKMNTGVRSDIDKDRLIAYWRVLANHYRGAKHQEIFEKGIRQLEKLTSEEAKNVIHEIRRIITPTLNREMERKEIKIGLNLPIIGKIGLGKFEWRMQGPRVSIRKFQRRLLRFICQGLLWSSVLFGTVHWVMWTMFNSPYLVHEFEGMAKVVQFVLLFPASVIMLWMYGRDEGPQLPSRGRKLARASFSVWRVCPGSGWMDLLVNLGAIRCASWIATGTLVEDSAAILFSARSFCSVVGWAHIQAWR